jgi:hypothetical protein
LSTVVLLVVLVFVLAAVALAIAAVLLALAAGGRRVVTPGAARPPARETVLPPKAAPGPLETALPAPAPDAPSSADAGIRPPVSSAAVAAIPASILAGAEWPVRDAADGVSADSRPSAPPPPDGLRPQPASERLVAGVELGFEGTGERIGVRPGSSTERGYDILAEELLGDLRRAVGTFERS